MHGIRGDGKAQGLALVGEHGVLDVAKDGGVVPVHHRVAMGRVLVSGERVERGEDGRVKAVAVRGEHERRLRGEG